MKKIFISSKFRGNIEENIEKARQISREVVMKGDLPLTPHIYFTLFLDDSKMEERKLGMKCSLNWIKECDEFWICDKEISEGMKQEIKFAMELNKKIVEKWRQT